MVSEYAVGAAKVEVTAVPQQVLAVGAHAAVREGDDFVGHLQAVGGGFCLPLFRDLGGGQAPAGAGVDDVAIRGVGRTGRMELGAGAKAGVNEALCSQLFVAGGVDIRALALVIGAVGAAVAAALVPVKAQPRKIFFQQVGVLAGAALGVKVLDAEDDAPALMLGAQPRQQTAREIAQMQPPTGAGGKPPNDGAHRPSFHSPSFGWEMGVL